MLVQAGLCRTCSETTLLVFPVGGSIHNIVGFILKQTVFLVCTCMVRTTPSFLRQPTRLRITNITKTRPCNIQRFFKLEKLKNFSRKFLIFFFIFAQNIDCGYTLEPPRRVCFGAKTRKIDIPLHTPILLYKSGVQGGILVLRTCFPDEQCRLNQV